MEKLRFECQRGCTACCERDGDIFLTEEDLASAAKFLKMPAREFEKRYVRRARHTLRLRKSSGRCPFLNGGCAIHPAKPTQCRLFPFWPETVERDRAWKATARWCPGIGKGKLIQIEKARTVAGEMKTAYPWMY